MKNRLFLCLLSLLVCMIASAQVTLNFTPDRRSHTISDTHYGIFFEEINHAGDGGLYAELIRNRSFEDNDGYPEYWSAEGATISLTDVGLMNAVQRHALNVKANAAGATLSNSGFWGMRFVKGETYRASLWVKSDAGYKKNLTLTLCDNGGAAMGTATIALDATSAWKKYEAELTATGDVPAGHFRIEFGGAGEVQMDMVSLFPPTFKDRPNGCRRDLAQMLADMKPRFMRFPGGCYIEGEYRGDKPYFNGVAWQDGSTNRFEWKQTIGALEERPGHWNINWNYRVSDGLGFHEMLQLAEDLGAEPLYVVNMGMGHGWTVPFDNIEEYIQEALDALEYCNGDETTPYGKLRAQNGHPQPFNLRLIEIGNENYQANSREQSDHYAERYIQFYEAIKAKYPECICIGNVEAWGTDNPSWRNSHPVDAVDEHYYRSPDWFVAQYEKYNAYDREKMKKVYAGEYAVTQNFGTHGNLDAALGEAVYMLGMENNSDICIMNSYAPIFVNENDQKWMPDMIRFNSSEAYGTPSYYVQKLMANYVGKQNVTWSEKNNVMDGGMAKHAGLSTWSTSAEFTNFRITRADGSVYAAKFDNTENWNNGGGIWSENNGVLVQESTTMQGRFYMNLDEDLDEDYTIEVDATKTGGAEGFLIAFNYANTDNYCWWNIGGWNNTKHAVEVCRNGTKSTVAERQGYLENGVTYHIKIEVKNQQVKCFMNDELYHSFALPSYDRKVYVASTIDDAAGKMYVKLVNPRGDEHKTTIDLGTLAAKGGKLIQMASASNLDQNTNDEHFKVVPTEMALPVSGRTFTMTVPAYSFNILELDVEEAAAENPLESTTSYFYDSKNDLFLSRGADWGTRATLDEYGLPINVNVTSDANECQLTYADQNGKFFGGTVERNPEVSYPYTDLNATNHIAWQLVKKDYGTYVLLNKEMNQYLAAGTENNGCMLTSEAGKAIEFSLLTAEQYKFIVGQRNTVMPKNIESYTAQDVSDMLENPAMEDKFSGWESSFVGNGMNVQNNFGLAEVFQGYGMVKQTITGLKPGWYSFSLPAFFRGGTNETCSSLDAEGFTLGNAYIFANGDKVRVATWASDRTSDYSPNNMEEASQLMGEGKYQNTVYTQVGDDGTLTVGIAVPQYNPVQWFICAPATLTNFVKTDYTDMIENPSFEQGLSGWTYYNIKTQNNNEVSAMKEGSYYAEQWVSPGNALGYVVAMQTIENLPAGKYILSANCHAEQQNNSSIEPEGVALFAGDNNEVLISTPQRYELLFEHAGGNLLFGFKAMDANVNWVTVDDFRLVVASVEAYRGSLDKAIARLEEVLDNKDILTRAMVRDARKAITDSEAATTPEEIQAAIAAINAEYEKCKAYRLNVERDEPYKKYLFAYFPSNNDENLYFAVSDDAFSYTPLNNGQRIMDSEEVALKKGIRDPHLIRGMDGKTFYMVATDMRCADGWDSNRGIVMYKSNDLVHWTHHTVNFPDRFPEWAGVTRVWAPATVWDPDYENADGTKGRYMIYYSLLTNDGKCRYDKVYYSYANDDFSDLLTEPVYLYDRGSATIDADIVYDECDHLYHMIYKNEGSGGICSVTAKRLTAEPGKELGSQWSKPSGTLQQTSVAVEGGGLFRLINTNTWVLMYDCYTSGRYEFCTTDDWEKYTKQAETMLWGAFTPRHGSVIPVTPEEYNTLLKAFPTDGLEELPTAVSEVKTADKSQHTKLVENAKVMINHNGKKYNAVGVEER